MAINTSQIRDLLRPGLREVTGKYKDIPTQYKQVFTTTQSTMQIERTAHVAYMGLAQIKQEGGATGFDNNAGQRWVYNAETFEVGLAYAITRKAIRDDLYKTEFKPTALGLGKAFKEFWEINSFNVFNNGTTYDSSIVGDGKALFATDHPVDGGATAANRFTTDLGLNEASLMQAIKNIRTNWVDERNLKIMGRPKSGKALMVPVNLMDVAERITKTPLRPGTADNDINADRTVEGGITDYMVCDYLTSNFAWFVLTQNEGLKFFERDPYETDMWVDNTTDNLLVKAYQRAQAIYTDWRCGYGSFASA